MRPLLRRSDPDRWWSWDVEPFGGAVSGHGGVTGRMHDATMAAQAVLFSPGVPAGTTATVQRVGLHWARCEYVPYARPATGTWDGKGVIWDRLP